LKMNEIKKPAGRVGSASSNVEIIA
jgi:hypothetical protein